MKKILFFLVRGYQKFISPFKPPCCRFSPTCSHYMIQAVARFGAFRGFLLGCFRIFRCNPFFRGGYDPVPFQFTFSGKQLPRVTLKSKPVSSKTSQKGNQG